MRICSTNKLQLATSALRTRRAKVRTQRLVGNIPLFLNLKIALDLVAALTGLLITLFGNSASKSRSNKNGIKNEPGILKIGRFAGMSQLGLVVVKIVA